MENSNTAYRSHKGSSFYVRQRRRCLQRQSGERHSREPEGCWAWKPRTENHSGPRTWSSEGPRGSRLVNVPWRQQHQTHHSACESSFNGGSEREALFWKVGWWRRAETSVSGGGGWNFEEAECFLIERALSMSQSHREAPRWELFNILCEKMRSAHKCLQLHNQVCWLPGARAVRLSLTALKRNQPCWH